MQMEIESLIRQYDFNYSYAQALVKDLSDEQMTLTPAKGLVNHAAFTLGHLVSGSALVAKKLGSAYEMQKDWKDLFLRKGPGDPREPDLNTDKYPSKVELLQELKNQHEEVKSLLRKLDLAFLSKEQEWRFKIYMPILYDYLLFMCVNHEAMHLGQLAAWRRSIGLTSALATL